MASVTVDVDIDEFNLDEILDGVDNKWNGTYSPNKDKYKKQIREFFRDLIDGAVSPIRSRSTVIDELKLDIVMKGIENKSVTELQEFFK
jgi:hypothetical protein